MYIICLRTEIDISSKRKQTEINWMQYVNYLTPGRWRQGRAGSCSRFCVTLTVRDFRLLKIVISVYLYVCESISESVSVLTIVSRPLHISLTNWTIMWSQYASMWMVRSCPDAQAGLTLPVLGWAKPVYVDIQTTL